jgi:hypothetical protein
VTAVARAAVASTVLLLAAGNAEAGGPDTLVEAARLAGGSAGSAEGFGTSVAASDSTVVVGAPGPSAVGGSRRRGAVYVFDEPAGGWAWRPATAKLTASDGADGDELGFSVAVSGDTIVAGAPGAVVGGHSGQGAVYVFRRTARGWVSGHQTAKLTAADGGSFDQLGFSVSASGGTIAAGAPGATIGGATGGLVLGRNAQGATYVYRMPAAGWSDGGQTAKLVASDGAASDQLGYSVSTDGSGVVAGAPNAAVAGRGGQGTAYVFSPQGGDWSGSVVTTKLTAPDGAAGDAFGYSVGVAGATALVGAPSATTGGHDDQGAAYLFSAPDAGWGAGAATNVGRLSATRGAAGDLLGSAVGIAGGRAIAGAPGATTPGRSRDGAAYVFAGRAGRWVETARLSARDGSDNALFGSSVATTATVVVAGARGATGGAGALGAAYVFSPPPRLTRMSQSARRWREAARRSPARRALGTPVGTTFRFNLNLAARVEFDFDRRGRRIARLRLFGYPGQNEVRFRGRVPRRGILPPGSYVVTVRATTPTSRSPARTLRFTIVR